MILDDIINEFTDKKCSFFAVDLCIYPTGQYVLQPFYRNYLQEKAKIYTNDGYINYFQKGNLNEDKKEVFYTKLANCIKELEILHTGQESPIFENKVRKLDFKTKFFREYKRNMNSGYHYIYLSYITIKPILEAKIDDRFQLEVIDVHPHKHHGSWGGNCMYKINKDNIEKFLYDDILNLYHNTQQLYNEDLKPIKATQQ